MFRTGTEVGLTYGSQSQGELDRALDRRRKLQVQLEGTGARGTARGRRRKQAEEELAEIQRLVDAFESGLVLQDQNRRAQARERRRSSLERLDAARAAMAQRKDVQPEWVITTFGTLVDGLSSNNIPGHLPDTAQISFFGSRPAGKYWNFAAAGLSANRQNARRSARVVLGVGSRTRKATFLHY